LARAPPIAGPRAPRIDESVRADIDTDIVHL
jgi:hypothetical protein